MSDVLEDLLNTLIINGYFPSSLLEAILLVFVPTPNGPFAL